MVARANARHDWIAEQSPARADKWYRGLFEKIETLKLHPHVCPVATEKGPAEEELRYLIYGKRKDVFRILFTIQGDVIRIVSMIHAAQESSEL